VGLIFIPLGSLSLVKYPVLYIGLQFFSIAGPHRGVLDAES
jgi:hypothetical protein